MAKFDIDTVTVSDLSTEDILDIRDLIELWEELDEIATAREDWENDEGRDDDDEPDDLDDDQGEVYKALAELLDELKGCGGDEQWRGDWYPLTLIRDSYFVDYARELVEDCGYISKDLPGWIALDWERTAEAVQQDYSIVSIGGVDFWYR